MMVGSVPELAPEPRPGNEPPSGNVLLSGID